MIGRFIFACLLPFIGLTAKVLVITHAYLRPDFIEIQDKTFRAFLKDDYEFVVFNDAAKPSISRAIQKACHRLHLRCIQIPQEIHKRAYLPRMDWETFDHPVIRCANVVQYSLNNLGFAHDGLVMIIDSDMFLIDDFSVAEYMQDYDLSGFPQSRGPVEYLWNGILFFNMNTLPAKTELSFNSGNVLGQPCDVGGYTYYYLRNHPEARLKWIGYQTYVGNHAHEEREKLHPYVRLMLEENVPNCEFFMNFKLFHYRGGGNWDYQSNEYHRHKTKALHKLIDRVLAR